MSAVAEQIKTKRQRLSMTQKEFANTIGLGRYGDRTVRRWECDESTPSKLELNAILKFPEKAPFANPEKFDYSMIDLFAGIGGTRLGFYQTERVGNVFSSEWDKFSQKTYQANFGEMPEGDITKIQAEDIPDHDILVGGFPCQAFSQAGKKLGFEDTRGTLFFDVARIIKGKRPKAFMLENVKNLKNHDHGRTFKVIMNTLIGLDYNVYYTTFHARDFGIPQKRERIYIVGFDKHQISSHDTFCFPRAPKKKTHVGDILEPNSSVDEKYTISDKLWEGHKRRKAQHKAKGNGFGYSLFTAESPYTNTISARYYKDGSEILIKQEGRNPRKLTPREAARLQGFPENYIIPVSDTQAYKEFGNSVCVPVIHAIAEQVLDVLDDSKN